MKTDKNLFLYLLTYCTLAIDICLSALNSIAQPLLLLKNNQTSFGHPQLMPVYNFPGKNQHDLTGSVFDGAISK